MPQPAAISEAPASGSGSSLPFSGAPAAAGAVDGLAIAPTVKPPTAAVEATGPNETQNLFWMMTLALMAVPGFLLMALIATVLVRR